MLSNIVPNRVSDLLTVSFAAIFVAALSGLPFNFASARPESSTLHDYSVNISIGDLYPGNTTDSSLKILSNADKFLIKAALVEKKLHFEVEGPSSNQSDNQILNGYFEITIPHSMVGGKYSVLVNNQTITNVNMTYNKAEAGDQQGDSTTIAFNYDGSTARSIDIYGTTAIPEFPILLPLSFVAAIAIVMARLLQCKRIT